MKIFFEAPSVLASYNLDLPNALSLHNIDVLIDVEHPLLFAIYLYERVVCGRYRRLRVVPPYIDRFVRVKMMRRVDVVHLNSLNVELARKAKMLGKPVIAVLHAAPFPEELYNAIDDYVDVYVASSNFTKQSEEAKADSKKIAVIHHSVDTELFNPRIPREEARRMLGIPLNAKVILWNDRISPEKDLETFDETAVYILRDMRDVYIIKSYKARLLKGSIVMRNLLITRLGYLN